MGDPPHAKMLKGSALGSSDPITLPSVGTSREHGACPCRGVTWGPKGGTSPIGPEANTRRGCADTQVCLIRVCGPLSWSQIVVPEGPLSCSADTIVRIYRSSSACDEAPLSYKPS